MDLISKKEREDIRHFFSLFSTKELKSIFRKYIIFMTMVEIAIFVSCWFYQAGSSGYDRFGPVNVPFPWKVYFLTAFIVPIAITFVMGLFIMVFENFILKKKEESVEIDSDKRSKTSFRRVTGYLAHMNSLLTVLGAGVAALIFYHLDKISELISRAGLGFFKVVEILAYGSVFCLGVGAVTWLILNYKVRKREMDYKYRLEIVDKIGVAWVDKESVIDKDGKIYFNLGAGADAEDNDSNIIYLPGIKKKGHK